MLIQTSFDDGISHIDRALAANNINASFHDILVTAQIALIMQSPVDFLSGLGLKYIILKL
jgi:hypothetical protein